MGCPKFVDFTRLCLKVISEIPPETLPFCMSDNYINCPFYRIIEGKGISCENIKNCPIFSKFQFSDFDEFVKMSKEYCLSENCLNCRRYILKKSGQAVPIDLYPDGSSISKHFKNKTRR